MVVGKPLPVRMCVAVPLEDGTWQAFCIACKWQPRKASPTRAAAERKALRHCCPRPKESA